ncbi:alpha/beta hydrolase [Bifidobacterium merycicum]|uniref:alpha/beta hydrolase n=1 Tax=Bifidobacterium merycicum TaxID=78345 RepID=UPI0023F478CE|nr:alpha/beta hydrolase-fold protein [Bifidobacterium merycicum]
MLNQPWLKPVMECSLVSGALPWTFWILTIAGMIAVLAFLIRGGNRRQVIVTLIATVVSGGLGYLLTWLCSDVFVVFGVEMGAKVIRAVAIGFAALALLICGVVFLRKWKRVVASVAVVVALFATCIHVDAIYEEFPTVGSLFGYTGYSKLSASKLHKSTMSVKEWKKLAAEGKKPTTPKEGRIYNISIPATESGFKVRDAMVYLPPAALSANPPKLPVMELMAGQPGSPGRFFQASHIKSMLDEYASKHDGLAPIVISPDQNGSNSNNSLCADTSQGKAETYLTRDVVDWVKENLPVSNQRWAIGGFSQGGTCATQLGPRHPKQYSLIMAVGGELQPTSGSVEHMVSEYFNGNQSAYDSQIPANAIKEHAPSDQVMILGSGALDHQSLTNLETNAQAGIQAGMTVVKIKVPDSAHDWHAVQAVLKPTIDWFADMSGLGKMTKTFNEYESVEVLP